MIKSQIWLQLDKKVSIISNVPTDPDSNRKKNVKNKQEQLLFYKSLQMGLLAITLSYTKFITSNK